MLILGLFVSITLIAIATSQLDLISDNTSRWDLAKPNESYKDWPTYEMSIEKGLHTTPIPNLWKDKFCIAWKSEREVGFLRHVYIYKNNISYPELQEENLSSYNNNTCYDVSSNDKLKLVLNWELGGGKVWIAFNPMGFQPMNENVTNEMPKQPEILSGPDKGYNDSLYNFSVRSEDPNSDQLNYTFDWGDGKIFRTKFLKSGDIATGSHSWSQAGIYDVRIMATDERGGNSTVSPEKKVKISWLKKVPSGAHLQSVVDSVIVSLHSDITFLLEGKDYDGPLNITDVNDINISSNGTESNVKSGMKDYVIGLEHANNVTINRLDIIGINPIGLHSCSHCKISNNSIYFEMHGIHILGGHDNIVDKNDISGANIKDSTKGCAGISLEDTWKEIVTCNNITGLDKLDSVFYIRNSTFKEFRIIVPSVHGNIIQYDPSTKPGLNGDECCCNFTGKKSICKVCLYDSDEIETNCSCNVSVGICG